MTTPPRIIEWGTPPDPEPTGWDAIATELRKRAGKWANVGEHSTTAARRVGRATMPDSEGFEHRLVPTDDEGARRVILWVRWVAPTAAGGAE